MDQDNKKAKLTVPEAEQKICGLLQPWIHDMFRLKEMRGELVGLTLFFVEDTRRGLGHRGKMRVIDSMLRGEQILKLLKELNESQDDFYARVSTVLRQTEATHIQRIKLMARACLIEYRREINDIYGWRDNDWMNDAELEDLAQQVVFSYLELWLEKDTASHLTIEDFTRYGYGEKVENTDYDNVYENRKAGLARAYGVREKMYRSGREQKKRMDIVTHPVSYKRNNKRILSLLDLAWCEAWYNGDLDLLKVVFFRKNLPNRKSEHDAKQNLQLKQALNRYAEFVKRFAKSWPNDEGQTAECKAYVANCCLIQTLERGYYFSLAGHLADYALEHGCRPDRYNKVLLSAYIANHQIEEWILILESELLDKNGQRKHSRYYKSWRTLGFADIMEQIYTNLDVVREDQQWNRELMRRIAADNALMMSILCDTSKHRVWSEEDYREAAEFLRNEYRFLDRLTTWELPELDGDKGQQTEQQKTAAGRIQKFLDYYYTFFLELYKDESTLTKQIVADMTKRPAKKGKQLAKS